MHHNIWNAIRTPKVKVGVGHRARHVPSQGAGIARDVLARLALELLHAKQAAVQSAITVDIIIN